MRIWIDFENTPQVHFLQAIKQMLHQDGNEFVLTARDVFETVKLLEQKTDQPVIGIGKGHGKSFNKKLFLMLRRFVQVFGKVGPFDLSLSCGSESAIWTSFLKGKRAIAFGDNDTARQWTYSRFVDFCFFPKAVPTEVLLKQGIKRSKLYQYDGYKENVYIAGYQPNEKFTQQLPFSDYVLVRPENIYANYMRNSGVKSICPELIKALIKNGHNVLYLPKYPIDFEYAPVSDKIFIPEAPINGLDACYFADAVLTGAGTLAREACCLGTPSVSFYAGKELMAVDKELIKEKKVFYSRDVDPIISYITKSQKSPNAQDQSKRVYEEVKEKLKEVVNGLNLPLSKN